MITDTKADWPSGETGRFLVTLKANSPAARARLFNQLAGREVISATESINRPEYLELDGIDARYYANVGIAVVSAPPEVTRLLKWESGSGKDFESVEPERYGHVQQFAGSSSFADDYYTTWGLKAVRADRSHAIGREIRIAVLDSGLDFTHPEFSKGLWRKNFVELGKDCQDVYGHGTHTAGTLCCSRVANTHGRGLGVAPGAQLIVGKVLTDAGWYRDEWVIAGIDWAIASQAQVVSLSLGGSYDTGASDAYEAAGRRAMAAGSLVIAAAGNCPGPPLPVFTPANCDSIMAVGAVDHRLQVAGFSALGKHPPGGEIDVVAPGVDVLSTVPGNFRRDFMSGTSMAAPHAAGCAALWAEATGARGAALREQLRKSARKLGGSVEREGLGLVQAP